MRRECILYPFPLAWVYPELVEGPIVKWYNSSFAMRDCQFDSGWVHKKIFYIVEDVLFVARIELGKGSGKREFPRSGITQTDGFESAVRLERTSSEFCLGPQLN